jgi:anti-sigma regulatory factor (Ser/Thr protein kinase)/anti-anti-sigma regulatory factor
VPASTDSQSLSCKNYTCQSWPTGYTTGVSSPSSFHEPSPNGDRGAGVADDVPFVGLDGLALVEAMQAALLPNDLPVLPDARISARYLVAADAMSAGGDWFDTIVLPHDQIALVIGDVVGHGVAAAAAMGRLRALTHYLLMRERDLPTAIDELHAVAGQDRALRGATVAVVVADRGSGSCNYVTCGHPPPLVIGADNLVRTLRTTGGGPLGMDSDVSARSESLGPGETLLLYSDGLVERPGRSILDGIDELVSVVGRAAVDESLRADDAPTADRVCQLSVDLLAQRGYIDDVTTLAMQRVQIAPDRLSIEFSDVASGSSARRTLRSWLREFDVSDDDLWRLELAAGELISNAVEHGQRADGLGPGRVDATLRRDGTAEVIVSDQGQWRDPAHLPDVGGRGLFIARELVDSLRIERPAAVDAGTRSTIEQQLRRAALVGAEPLAPPPRPTSDRPFEIVRDDDGSGLSVSGSVDTESVEELSKAIRQTSRGGALPIRLDLSDVTLLSSVGVRSLFDGEAELAQSDSSMTIVARAGSPAATVLDLVRLPYEPH